MDETYRKAKKFLIAHNILAYKPKTLAPSIEGDEVVDYDELFENFDLQEFQKVFNKNHIKFYNTMAICFIFFMSNYVWDHKIYLSKPNILLPIMDDILVFLNLTRRDYISLFGEPIREGKTLKLQETSEYTGTLQSHRFKPYAIQIEKYFKGFRISGSGAFFHNLDNKEYEILSLDEPLEYFKSLYFRPSSRIQVNEFLLLRDCNSEIEREYEKLRPNGVTINASALDKLKIAYN